MESITFVTSNAKKATELSKFLGLPLQRHNIDLPEFQGMPTDVAVKKCELACELIDGLVLIEDSSLCFDAYGGLPGPYIKDFYSKIGNIGLVQMLAAFPNKTAHAKCIFALGKRGSAPELFVGDIRGTIVPPRGAGFDWDPIFLPDGSAKTYAELGPRKIEISHRTKAAEKFYAWTKRLS